jgi:hypothetical protein
MAEQNVNATSGNKKVLIGPRRFSRMNSPKHGSEGKTLFRCRGRPVLPRSVARIERNEIRERMGIASIGLLIPRRAAIMAKKRADSAHFTAYFALFSLGARPKIR